jgi:hypothetical protein
MLGAKSGWITPLLLCLQRAPLLQADMNPLTIAWQATIVPSALTLMKQHSLAHNLLI